MLKIYWRFIGAARRHAITAHHEVEVDGSPTSVQLNMTTVTAVLLRHLNQQSKVVTRRKYVND